MCCSQLIHLFWRRCAKIELRTRGEIERYWPRHAKMTSLNRKKKGDKELKPCLQGGRVTLVLGLLHQKGYRSNHTFLLFFIDVFTRQLGLPWR